MAGVSLLLLCLVLQIREGVYKSFQVTQEHFAEEYGKKIRFFIYNSAQLTEIDRFASDNSINVMIINSQAFNAKGKDARRIYMKLDEFRSRRPIDIIAKTNPIVIIDEPQSVEGKQTKENLKQFNPLMTLRYSATHKSDSIYNMIYRLDAMEAYNKKLVKKIAVKGITESGSTATESYVYLESINLSKAAPTATIQFDCKGASGIRKITRTVSERYNLYDNSGKMEEYKQGFVISRIDGRDDSVEFINGIKLYAGDVIGKVSEEQIRRIQIRETILSHIQRERELFHKGIKVLSLFFIDEVAKYKQYDEAGAAMNGTYADMFEEEYKDIISNLQIGIGDDDYIKYLNEIPAEKTHAGYFSIDKKGKMIDSKVGRKETTTDDVDAYDLIMKNKELLLDRNPKKSPVRFIFSHSALREGWDNPNVFTLCTLKSGGSDIAKKQEIGRGLRLPVDITGNRCIDKRINELTVIANDYYDHFAAALQKDFNDNMHFDKDEVTAEILITTLKTAGVPASKITPELVDIFKQELVSAGVMNSNNMMKGSSDQITKIFDNMIFVNDTLNEHAEIIKKQFKEMMIQKGTRKIEIVNGDNAPYENKVRAYVTEGEFKKIYMALRQNLMKRTIYKFKIDKDQFIEDCIFDIDQTLLFKKAKNEYKVETGRAKFNSSAMFVMEETVYGDKQMEIEISSDPKSDFEIANYIMHHTMLPRLAIFKIIQGIDKRELLNNQDILDEVTQLILQKLNDTKAANIISYEVINGYELDESNIFELDTISAEDFEQEWRVFQARSDRSSAMNEYYKMDSEGEAEFAHKLENNTNVLLFTKLKKGGFVIDTPYGNYSPDWAVVCKKEALEDASLGIYFIVETKAGKREANLQDVERNKIHCGKLHFKAVSDQIKFDWVNSYEDFRTKFGVSEGN